MKSINNIFNKRKDLLLEPEVSELVNYCLELEDEVVENRLKINQTQQLKQIIGEILHSCQELGEQDLLHDRYPKEFEKVDYESSVKNLIKYIQDYCEENYINL